MTSVTGSAGAYGALTVLSSAVRSLQDQQTSIAGSLASGKVSNSYAGLGSAAYGALSLQPQMDMLSAWQSNVTAATTQLSVAQTALTQIGTVAATLQSSLASLVSNNNATTVQTAAASAKAGLGELVSLLNTQSGGTYVFAGIHSDQAPVPDAGDITSSSYYTQIASAVASVGSAGAAATAQKTLSVASSNVSSVSVFSSALSVSASDASALQSSMLIGDEESASMGLVATAGGSASATSTGSSIRDLMRALATVANFGSADSSSNAFQSLVTNTQASVDTAASTLSEESGLMGGTQTLLTQRGSDLSDLSDALTSQYSSLTDADLATLSTQQSLLQTQLSASYSLISDMKGMSLAAYL